MKKVFALTLAVMLVASPVFAGGGESETATSMGHKLMRGFRNTLTGILEVPFQIGKGYSNGIEQIDNQFLSKTVGTVLGVFRGFSHAAGRTGSGMMEMVGFWAANEPSVSGIPLDAEYAWEEGAQYSIFKPTLSEGLDPVGKKLGHGLANAFLGVLEFPGQIKKGINDGNGAKGLVKGVWYWFSREVNGMGQVVTFLLPAPAENVGPMFDEEMPWDALSNN